MVLVSLELARVVTPALAAALVAVGDHHHRRGGGGLHPESDPFSMFALAIPLTVFYFLSIGIGKLLGR